MIEVRDLVHRYGERSAVAGVTLSVSDGEFVIMAGRNGSGKTTLVRHFNGLLEPDEGSVLVNGRHVTDDLVAARTAIGMVFQHPPDQFVAATIGEDVAFGPENLGLPHPEIDRRVRTALEAVQMAGREIDRIDELSGGEQARVAIAGALAMEPDHLVLDEPFVGLDHPARRTVLGRLTELHENGTGIIMVTHDPRDVLDRADRVIVLKAGQVTLDTTPENARSILPSLGVRVA